MQNRNVGVYVAIASKLPCRRGIVNQLHNPIFESQKIYCATCFLYCDVSRGCCLLCSQTQIFITRTLKYLCISSAPDSSHQIYQLSNIIPANTNHSMFINNVRILFTMVLICYLQPVTEQSLPITGSESTNIVAMPPYRVAYCSL